MSTRRKRSRDAARRVARPAELCPQCRGWNVTRTGRVQRTCDGCGHQWQAST